MTAPLLLRLDAALRETADVGMQAELAAQMASYKARIGEFEGAEALRLQLRERFGQGNYGRVSIRLMALDALLLYYRELSPKARDRMLRANLIAGALRLRDLQALTASWLAHIDFNLDRFTEMAKWLAECFEYLEADDGSSKLRVSLVLGDAFQFADMEAQARLWYEQARRLASQLGDQAAFGAITYNRAALHVSTGRLRQQAGTLSAGTLSLIDGEVRSAINYQLSAGLRSLDHLLSSMSIGVNMLNEEWATARSAIEALKATGDVAEGTGARAILLADEALCIAKIGNGSEAGHRLEAVGELPLDGCSSDDRALVAWSLARGHQTLGNTRQHARYLEATSIAVAEHQITLATLRELLEPYVAGPTRQ
jgi:hypothetical protein